MSVISPAAVAAFAAALYCAAVIAARAARWSPVAPHPLLLAAVASLYLVIALVATRRTGLVRRVAGDIDHRTIGGELPAVIPTLESSMHDPTQ